MSLFGTPSRARQRLRLAALIEAERQKMDQLSQEQFDRIDRALGLVLQHSAEFQGFAVDFALHNADRLEKYGLNTFWSASQWGQIEKIEEMARKVGLSD